jgi:hypothetical protein
VDDAIYDKNDVKNETKCYGPIKNNDWSHRRIFRFLEFSQIIGETFNDGPAPQYPDNEQSYGDKAARRYEHIVCLSLLLRD